MTTRWGRMTRSLRMTVGCRRWRWRWRRTGRQTQTSHALPRARRTRTGTRTGARAGAQHELDRARRCGSRGLGDGGLLGGLLERGWRGRWGSPPVRRRSSASHRIRIRIPVPSLASPRIRIVVPASPEADWPDVIYFYYLSLLISPHLIGSLLISLGSLLLISLGSLLISTRVSPHLTRVPSSRTLCTSTPLNAPPLTPHIARTPPEPNGIISIAHARM
ncbi:hypothetical protein DFH09DRAFT_1166985 [Mycena vulgaris]|nr:hypothetical protein DFH09DRAFT_1166985 [Mycena vulgaris]